MNLITKNSNYAFCLLAASLFFSQYAHADEVEVQINGQKQKLEIGELVTGGENIKHAGYALIDGLFAEMGLYTYEFTEGEEEEEAVTPSFSGLLVGDGSRIGTDLQGEICWEPLKFTLHDLIDVDGATGDFRVVNFQQDDCNRPELLNKNIVLRSNNGFSFPIIYPDGDGSYDKYFSEREVWTSVEGGPSVAIIFDNLDHRDPDKIANFDESDFEKAYVDIAEPLNVSVPDELCAYVHPSERANFIKLLESTSEVWWYTNAFSVRSAKLAQESWDSEKTDEENIRNYLKHVRKEYASPYERILEITSNCVEGSGTAVGDEFEIFQIHSYPFNLGAMYEKISAAGLAKVYPMYFDTAGGTEREFFSVGSLNITNQDGEIDSKVVGAVLKDALAMAMPDSGKVEIVDDHPLGIPFAYTFKVLGFGTYISGDRTRWENLTVEIFVAASPNNLPKSLKDGTDYVATISMPITKARVWPESPRPPNLETGFSELSNDPALGIFLDRFRGYACAITACGLAAANLDDIDHAWISR